jgi:hypothetical protein
MIVDYGRAWTGCSPSTGREANAAGADALRGERVGSDGRFIWRGAYFVGGPFVANGVS